MNKSILRLLLTTATTIGVVAALSNYYFLSCQPVELRGEVINQWQGPEVFLLIMSFIIATSLCIVFHQKINTTASQNMQTVFILLCSSIGAVSSPWILPYFGEMIFQETCSGAIPKWVYIVVVIGMNTFATAMLLQAVVEKKRKLDR